TQQPMNRNHVFDSTGPDLRLRGTAQQLFEKYLQLGRDATGGGDRVMAEAYFQHAEHYFRIIGAMSQAQGAQASGQGPMQNQGQPNGHNQQRRSHPEDQQGDPEAETETEGEGEGEAETVQPVRGHDQAGPDQLAEAIEAELSAETEVQPRSKAARR
ncbi:MAG: DUF4167 domain-containing protein, partial [Rubritepida sp.]|nr:DUF4167 domain-containing protein [Rubritepida sp.]